MYDKCYFCLDQLPKLKKRIHSKLFRKFWRSRGTKEPAYITVGVDCLTFLHWQRYLHAPSLYKLNPPAHEVVPVLKDNTGESLLNPVHTVAPEVVAVGVVDFHLDKITMSACARAPPLSQNKSFNESSLSQTGLAYLAHVQLFTSP